MLTVVRTQKSPDLLPALMMFQACTAEYRLSGSVRPVPGKSPNSRAFYPQDTIGITFMRPAPNLRIHILRLRNN